MISTCDNRMVVAPPEGRALWLLHDGALLHLMASTSLMPARLTLTLQDCFDATVLHVDVPNKRLFLRPTAKEDEYTVLCDLLKRCTLVKVSNSVIKLSSVYICKVGETLIRGVVAKVVNPNQNFLVYGIDVGEEFLVDLQNFYELNPELRDMAPLCLSVVLSGCPMLDSCEEFKGLLEGCCCVCSLDKIYPSAYPEKVKELYPPAIVSHLYHKDNTTGKFVEILCTAHEWSTDSNSNMVENINSFDGFMKRDDFGSCGCLYSKRPLSKSDLYLSLVLENKVCCPKHSFESTRFQFPKYRVHLPFTVNVLITRKITFATYVMRDTYIITKVQAHIKHPCNPLVVDPCSFKGIACIARVKRLKDSRLQLYRAVLLQRLSRKNAYLVYLVDYGQRVTCDYDQVFDLQDQPPVILETPVAAFKCRVRRVWKQKGLKVNKLLDEEKYRICLTLKCGSKTYWGIVLSQTLVCGDLSFEDIEDCNTDVYRMPVTSERRSSDSTQFRDYLRDVSEEETLVSSVEDEDDNNFCNNDGDDSQDLRLLQAKAESIKRYENMTLLSVMLQQLSCRVDAMEILAGCNGWNPCVPAVYTPAYGYNQPPPYLPNSLSSAPTANSQGIRFPVAYLPQFPFDPNVPPPSTSPLPQSHFHFQNQGPFEQFSHFMPGRCNDNRYDVEEQCESTGSGSLTGSLLREKCNYKANSTTADSSCCENRQLRGSSNKPTSNMDFDGWGSQRILGSRAGDTSIRDMEQCSNSRTQGNVSGRCSYASALKKGLHTKNRGKVVVISSNDKKKKVRNVLR